MKGDRIAAALAALLLLFAAAADEGKTMSRKPEPLPPRPAPPIDRERPAETTVADFALG